MAKKVALLIGVSEYGEGIPSLSATLNDVAAMKRVLENPEMGGFEVDTLLNPDPTPMRKAIKKLFSSCGKEDLVLLFFSGHGITDDENKLYLATRITAKDDFDATAIPASFVAIADYNKAIKLNPDYADAYNNRGNAHKALKEYQKAIADYTESITLKNTQLCLPYYNRGNTYNDLESYQKAIADYTEAIKLKPDYANVYYTRGLAHSARKDYQAAIKDYQKAANLYKQQRNTKWHQNALNNIKQLKKKWF